MKGRPIPRAPSKAEELLALQIRAARLPPPEREVALIKGRRWRWDFAWPKFEGEIGYPGVAVEVQGVYRWKGQRCRACGRPPMGRHASEAGMAADYTKNTAAILAGWRVFHFTPSQIEKGEAVKVLKEVFR